MNSIGETLTTLADTIASRRDAEPSESYTAKLLHGPEDSLLKKIGEEATEVVMAAKDADRAQLRYEMADLLYHMLVVCERWETPLEEVSKELLSRM